MPCCWGGCQTKSGGNVKPRVEGHAQKGIHNALQKDFFAERHTREVSPTAPGGEINLRVEGETSQLMEGGLSFLSNFTSYGCSTMQIICKKH